MIPSLPYKLDHRLWFVRSDGNPGSNKASAPHAPYDSTAKGVHHHPSSEHLASDLECLCISAALAAVPAETPASK